VTDDLPRDDLFAATPQTAARLAGVTVRQLDYWRRIGLIEPAVARRLSPRNEVRLYDFTGLVELRIVAALRARLSLQHIREVVSRLRGSYDHPLSELRFAVQGRQLYFQHPDGSWEGGKRPVSSCSSRSSCWRRCGPTCGARRPRSRTVSRDGSSSAAGCWRRSPHLRAPASGLGGPSVLGPRRVGRADPRDLPPTDRG
jgi:DNA-binding transcriptional MerR regulator